MRSQRLHVLICDSDPETLIDLERMLEDAGFDTTTTWDTSRSRTLNQKDLFDGLILSDHPPQMNGAAILMDLRGKHLNVPYILCLAWQKHVDEQRVERLRSAGVTEVVSGKDHASIVERVEFYLRSPGPHSIPCAPANLQRR
jgi:DNA-binding response OmpR family regulator